MVNLKLFDVTPRIPDELTFLDTLSRNLWWSWNADAVDLFRRINPQLWKESGYSPLRFLNRIPQERLEQLAQDNGFLSQQENVRQHFDGDILTEVEDTEKSADKGVIAYFSLEYGIHSSLRLYSGGLGVLSGDHLKAASDLKIPLVGVGLLYRQGYFEQYLDNNGWQQEHYPENEIHHLPVTPACREGETEQVKVSIPLPDGQLNAQVWRLQVGRTQLYLLDTNIPENEMHFRGITGQLYGGDRHNRLRQELLLGIGGFRALIELGYEPAITHINEGHAGFLNLARIHHIMTEHELNLEEAAELVRRTTAFTTHTPVPAGNETFHTTMLRPYLEAVQQQVGIDPDTVISWGQAPEDGEEDRLSMTILALRLAEYSNGVSRLHGTVSRQMWSHLWRQYPVEEVPITHITNGVHVPTWVSTEYATLLDRYVGPEWRLESSGVLDRVDDIPHEELWHAHEVGRERLIRNVRDSAVRQLRRRSATKSEIQKARAILDHDVLTIGFARRFATYKRAALLLRDPARFEALLTDESRPVQFIFAGKAHPADDSGKELIRQIVEFSRKHSVHRRIIFLEDYNMHLARRLVQGVDVWLNTPRRPQEASGTSGMKSALNGGLHLSILDGWWEEGYTKERGWAIPAEERQDDTEYQDTVESQALFNLLENEVVPTFYERSDADMPGSWIDMMKESMKMGLRQFSSYRMVRQYWEGFYIPASENYHSLLADKAKRTRELVSQFERLSQSWEQVRVEMPEADRDIARLQVGESFTVRSQVSLGDLNPDDVDVQVYYGPVDASNRIAEPAVLNMELESEKKEGAYDFTQEICCEQTGRYGFTVRVTPAGNTWTGRMPGLISWASGG